MGANATEIFGDVEVHCVGVGRYDHVADSKSNATAGVGGNVVKGIHNGIIGCLFGNCLLLPYLSEGYKELVVDGLNVE